MMIVVRPFVNRPVLHESDLGLRVDIGCGLIEHDDRRGPFRIQRAIDTRCLVRREA